MKPIRAVGLGAALACVASALIANAERSRLPFIEDDYPRALAQARSKRVPIFLEAWAPW